MKSRGSASNAEIESARAAFEKLQSRFNALKIAYLNSTEFDGKPVAQADVKSAAREVIQANYRLQKAKYGQIRLKLSVSKLIRRGR